MKFKKIILITFLLLAVLTISAVSAVDENNTMEKYDLKTTYGTQTPIEQTNEELTADETKMENNVSENDILTNNNEQGDMLGYSYTFKMDSITVNKSSTSFKYPIHISTNGWSQNDVLDITIKDPNGRSSSGMYGFSGNTFYLDITPSIIGKYSVSVKISSYGSVSSSNNPTGYITVVDPNANTNTPTNSNTPTNTNTNINNDNYIQEYYEYEDYEDYEEDDYDDYDEDEYEAYLKAPTTKVKHKSNSYFKIKLLNFYDDPVKYKKITLKVWTGKKTKTYTLKTNSKGIAKFNTKKLKIGTHKVKITFKGSGRYTGHTIYSKIIVKKATAKKSSSKYKIINTKAKFHWTTKKSGKFKVKTIIFDMTAGFRAPYKYVDTWLYKNGNLLLQSEYKVKMKINGKWTNWKKAGPGTNHHRYSVRDSASVDGIKVRVHK